jgi:hypothetical protein
MNVPAKMDSNVNDKTENVYHEYVIQECQNKGNVQPKKNANRRKISSFYACSLHVLQININIGKCYKVIFLLCIDL